MIEQTFGPRRCRDTRKPPLDQCPEVKFYRCRQCNGMVSQMGIGIETKPLSCCGEETELLVPQELSKLPEGVFLDYQITGGYNDNTVLVSWKADNPDNHPEWIYLKTFTGGYQKFVLKGKRSPMRFALADLDAFAYCDEDPCLECTFRCKRGFVVYVYYKNMGLFQMPLDNMSPYWQSKE